MLVWLKYRFKHDNKDHYHLLGNDPVEQWVIDEAIEEVTDTPWEHHGINYDIVKETEMDLHYLMKMKEVYKKNSSYYADLAHQLQIVIDSRDSWDLKGEENASEQTTTSGTVG